MADILIKGMEMPKGDEDLRIIINSDGSIHRIIGWAISEKKATAIELPPHGRLVDGDKLLTDHNPNENWDYMVLECIIRNAQTVVEASGCEKHN